MTFSVKVVLYVCSDKVLQTLKKKNVVEVFWLNCWLAASRFTEGESPRYIFLFRITDIIF